jgi:hypothetical protein
MQVHAEVETDDACLQEEFCQARAFSGAGEGTASAKTKRVKKTAPDADKKRLRS